MQSLSTSLPRSKPKVLLPVVQRMIKQLDLLFVGYSGPVGLALAEEIFKQWLKAGKTGPSALRQYAFALGSQIDHPAERRQFTQQADELLLHLQSGFVN